MPIPKLPLSGKMTREDVIALYKEYGWDKILTFNWIELNQRSGTIKKKTYEFNADALPCFDRACRPYQLTFVQFKPHGVIKTCATCRRTEGPITFDEGRLVASEDVGLVAAWDTIKETGQSPPVGLRAPSGTEGLQIIL